MVDSAQDSPISYSVVINPDNGPGNVTEEAYTTGINDLNSAGVEVGIQGASYCCCASALRLQEIRYLARRHSTFAPASPRKYSTLFNCFGLPLVGVSLPASALLRLSPRLPLYGLSSRTRKQQTEGLWYSLRRTASYLFARSRLPLKTHTHHAPCLLLPSALSQVLCYVATGFGATNVSEVTADVDAYESFYPGLCGGYFFDEGPGTEKDAWKCELQAR